MKNGLNLDILSNAIIDFYQKYNKKCLVLVEAGAGNLLWNEVNSMATCPRYDKGFQGRFQLATPCGMLDIVIIQRPGFKWSLIPEL